MASHQTDQLASRLADVLRTCLVIVVRQNE